MRTVIKKVIRFLVLGLLFFLPRDKKIAIDRWLRGREEYRKLRDADCVVVSFGKSGRTWVRVLLSRFYQVRHGLAERHLIGFDNLHRKNPSIPKLFFTHDNYLKDYTKNAASKADYYQKKVILLVRDPIDVAVSQFFQWKYRMRPGKKKLNKYPSHGTDISIFNFVMDREAGLPKIVQFMNLWAREQPRVRQLLVVKYEDLREDTEAALKQMLEFIGTPGTTEQIREAVRFSSVENMRKMEQKRTFWLAGSRMVPKDRSNPNSFKVRKAKVGGYRDHFSEAEITRIRRLVKAELAPSFGYHEPPQEQHGTVR